jgi:hypothetical protein
MLVIGENMRDYFNETKDEIVRESERTRSFDENEITLFDRFNLALLGCHLYGCDWADIKRCRFTLFPDFAKWSFGFTIEFRNKTTKTKKGKQK